MRFYIPIFSITLLLSASLLFSIQPMFSKMILPILGGSSLVWNTAMMFFQVMLLLGYCYAHLSAKYLPTLAQAILFIACLCAATYVLPFSIDENSTTESITKAPLLWQLTIMFSTIGLPFFAKSACAPMLQNWFSQTCHKDASNPYFLYGASNIGSMVSLLSYPFLIEYFFPLEQQAQLWSYGFYMLILGVAICAIFTLANKKKTTSPTVDAPTETIENISWILRCKWLLFAFIPSSLMLGVTSYITTDIASIPLIWVIPLALYLLSFIIVFLENIRINPAKLLSTLSFLLIILAAHIFYLRLYNHGIITLAITHFSIFFIIAVICHDKLVKTKPTTAHLTEFYVFMSLGGALGGVFNSLIAPLIFVSVIEYQIVLLLALFICYAGSLAYFMGFKQKLTEDLKSYATQRYLILICTSSAFLFITPAALSLETQATALFKSLAAAMFLFTFTKAKNTFFLFFLTIMILPNNHFSILSKNFLNKNVLERSRNFYGAISVQKTDEVVKFIHGTTLHGIQVVDQEHRLAKTSYYHETSGLGKIFNIYDQRDTAQHIAVLGLGAGTISCYQKDGRHFDFFEIDPAVIRIAQNPEYFTFLQDCNSTYNIHLTDARIGMSKQPDKKYDLIIVDTFSSDNIPMHMVTKEAAEIFMRKIKDQGAVLYHISNRHYNLIPILANIAQSLELQAYYYIAKPIDITKNVKSSGSIYLALSTSEAVITELLENNWLAAQGNTENARVWTDQYSNILDAFTKMPFN